MQRSILIISPVRNEAGHIETVIRALAAQELPPARWIVSDDRSTDETLAILRRWEAQLPWMTVVSAADAPIGEVRDRLARAAAPRNFNHGLSQSDWTDGGYSHIMKLDGDIELLPSYLRDLMDRFEADPGLGLAGGVIKEPLGDGGFRHIQIPRVHVHGALKCYSRACFEAIGGIQERLGWDTIDGTYARMNGFRTHSFAEMVSIHHRPIGSADGTLRGHARHGECAYIAHYTPSWVALRALKVGRRRPAVLSGVSFLYGYCRAAARRVQRVPDPEYRRFTHRELRRRMLGALRPPQGGCPIRALIGRFPLIRSVVKSAPVQQQIMTARALTVLRGRPRFLTLQMLSHRIARYELRGSGLKFHVRHRTGDLAILNKIFAREGTADSYSPPPEVLAALGTGAPRILDVGANIGLFGVFANDYWPGARITAFEPDPDNLRVLRATVAANGLGDRWEVVEKAASNAPGKLSFVPGLRAEAHIAGAGERGTLTVPAVDLYEWQGSGVDLIKIDCEGGEWAILADPRLSSLKASVIRLEWHTLLCAQKDARAEAVRLLRAGGFAHILDADNEHDLNGVLWAWRDSPASRPPAAEA